MPVHIPSMPSPEQVAEGAAQILTILEGDPEFAAFRAASLQYSDDWQCFTGFPVISEWSLERDAEPLFMEGLRALALKAAVFAYTNDCARAEIPIAVPVDEMTHAMLAQTQLLNGIASRHGITVIHQTDQEHTDYEIGDFTHQCYTLAWGEPPARYWLGHEEVERRRAHLGDLYQGIGMGRSGREHGIRFEELSAA